MNQIAISDFYKTHVSGEHNHAKRNDYLGHFDLLSWSDLQKDISACKKLQRKAFYKISLLRGSAFYQAADRECQLQGPHIIITSPLVRYAFTPQAKGFEAEYCIFDEAFLRGSQRISISNWPIFKDRNIFMQVLSEEQYTYLKRIFESMQEEQLSDYSLKEHAVRNKVFDIIHFCQKLQTEDKTLYILPEDDLTNQFLTLLEHSFININQSQKLVSKSPSYFAGKLYTTVDHLNKTIKKTTGKTTGMHIHERIIQEANVLLKNSQLTISEIADMLHFQEANHFINFYKKYTQQTPLSYRRS